MDIKPIRTEEDYLAALNEIEALFDSNPDSPEGEKLEVLVTLVEAYESRHYQIPRPDPIDAIEYHMERHNLSRKDLEPYIGNRARVSEIINRKRPLSMRMIRNLHKALDIPLEILVQEYALDTSEENTDVGELPEFQNRNTWLSFIGECSLNARQNSGITKVFEISQLYKALRNELFLFREFTCNLGIRDAQEDYLVDQGIPVKNWPVRWAKNTGSGNQFQTVRFLYQGTGHD